MIYAIEKAIKKAMFDCQTCGQCILSHTALKCPMNCPKGLRNGPCGGTLNGKCEVLPDKNCVWVDIESRKRTKVHKIHLPFDKKLLNTASYVNLVLGKDKTTRLPEAFHDTSDVKPTSKLAQRMYEGKFTITFEIASPRNAQGLPRVHQLMERIASLVDGVNTTTNAGGKPSLHSTETAKVVAQYGVEPIIQFCGRDHEPSDFLREMDSALDLGYRNFLLLTGDWLPHIPRDIDQTKWFPMDSSQMIHLVNGKLRQFSSERGVVPYLGCASNPYTDPMETAVDRLTFKRKAGARFSQTQAVTNSEIFGRWYAMVRKDREHEPRLVIPSLPLIGTPKGLEILKSLPGVFVDPEFEKRLVTSDNLAEASATWALACARELRKFGAAGVHLMNFGMPAERIIDLIKELRAEFINLSPLNQV